MHIKEILENKSLPQSDTSRLDLELLLAEACRKPRAFLYANPEYALTEKEEKTFNLFFMRRKQGEPIAYIIGKKEFWSLEFAVNEKVLIPRPETELIVETVLHLDLITAEVADLGTGSGAIALALAKERPRWNIVATDISRDALQIASYNAMQLQVPNIEFYCGSWGDVLPDRKFDVIVSNPPYIAKDDPHLHEGDVSFEPKIALESGDGLDAFKEIIPQAKNSLKPNGLLVLEHGYDQSTFVQKLLRQCNYHDLAIYKDLANIYRVATGLA